MADGKNPARLVPAIFLDRDGVLNRDPGYVHKPSDLELFPDVVPALIELKSAGYKLIVISNQSGIGRGYFTSQDTESFHEAMKTELTKNHVVLDDFYYCPHAPEDSCQCRKPLTQMVDQAIEDHHVDRSRSWFIGDKPSDVECGINANVQPVFLNRNQTTKKDLDFPNIPTIASLKELSETIKKKA